MLRIEEDKQCCRVYIEGEMTIYNAAALHSGLLPVFSRTRDLEINLSGVTEMDSAGVQLLILAKHECDRQQHALTMVNHSSSVRDVFELMGLHALFNDQVVLSAHPGGQHGT